jgi:hypothetical protein
MTIKEPKETPQSKNKKSPKRSAKADKTEKLDRGLPKEDRFKDRWAQLNGDVRTALGYWNDLTQKYDGKMNRDQEQLHEIKSLLKELQKKIKVFND